MSTPICCWQATPSDTVPAECPYLGQAHLIAAEMRIV